VEKSEVTIWRGLEAAAVLLVLGFFLFALRGVLNPFLLFLLLWAVLIPFKGRPGHGTLLATSGVLTLIWLLATAGSVLAPFVLAVVMAYLLDPLVDRLEARRVPRAVAILLLALPALAALAALLLLGIPAAVQQLSDVAQQAPVFFQRVAAWLGSGSGSFAWTCPSSTRTRSSRACGAWTRPPSWRSSRSAAGRWEPGPGRASSAWAGASA